MKQNLYQILGVPQNASQSALDAAYTELLTKHKERHDLGGQDAKNELVTIKWAYNHLSNADKRAAYDVKLEAMPTRPRIVHPKPKVSSLSNNDEMIQANTIGISKLDYQLTENQTWAQTLLFVVYQPMVANKTGRYPLAQIVNQFPTNERAKVKEGIDALIEMQIFAIEGRDICITNRSEGLLQVINHIVGKPADAVEEMLKTSPAISSTLTMINNDIRFSPPSDVTPAAPVTIRSSITSTAIPASRTAPMFSWGIVLMVVGGFSFILPIFGRQFIIVSALGLTGIGSAMAGIVLFVIGILLFNAARNKESPEHPIPRSANYDVPQLIPASSSKATERVNVASPPLAQNNAPSFNMGNGESIEPHTYGLIAVKIGIADSQQAVDEMIGAGELPGQQSIRSKMGTVQLHL